MNSHGHCRGLKGRSRTYTSWECMKNRCTDPSIHNFRVYGEKGITICPEWLVFENFLRDMGERPVGKTLDRLDNAKGYYKDNCKWSTPAEQNRNRSTNNFLTHNGETLCLVDWAKKLGCNHQTLGERLRRGWSTAKTLDTPVKRKATHDNPSQTCAARF